MLEHPVIKLLRQTGYPDCASRRGKVCCDCGCSLKSGDSFYSVGGETYCECCMEEYREEVE